MAIRGAHRRDMPPKAGSRSEDAAGDGNAATSTSAKNIGMRSLQQNLQGASDQARRAEEQERCDAPAEEALREGGRLAEREKRGLAGAPRARLTMIFEEREANLVGDLPDVGVREGERVGTFVSRSPWPLPLGADVALLLIGLLFTPVLTGLAFVWIVIVLWGSCARAVDAAAQPAFPLRAAARPPGRSPATTSF